LCATAALLSGCATVWSRGVVQDAGGASIQSASIRVVQAGSSKPAAVIPVDRNGCFMVGPFVAHGEHRFELEVSAPGYKPATFEFDLQTPVLFGTLVPASAGESSEIRPATATEREGTWAPLCIPPMPPGASQLSP
ncbi:MAG TPA: carboxypeptidase-like regulatory domain-containing protein, partial [Thermoanaerobaculia bacterium]|nr:carboxypeptidase-like regulatory domain-containing protein [Thermoanaerobaculia bacterium]